MEVSGNGIGKWKGWQELAKWHTMTVMAIKQWLHINLWQAIVMVTVTACGSGSDEDIK